MSWLYETARLTAVTFIRREQEAHMQTALNENHDDAWPHIASLLDDALAGLSAADRHAVVLRYFDGKSRGEVGAVLGASEDAAKKRAVEKLRGWFTKRGVTLTATVLTAGILPVVEPWLPARRKKPHTLPGRLDFSRAARTSPPFSGRQDARLLRQARCLTLQRAPSDFARACLGLAPENFEVAVGVEGRVKVNL